MILEHMARCLQLEQFNLSSIIATQFVQTLCGHYFSFSWTPMFEWYIEGHQKGTCFYEIGQCAHNISTILGSIASILLEDHYIH